MATEHIGFVGVGLMGHGMAANILKGGYPLTVIAHRNRAPVDALVADGAQEAASLAELAQKSTIVFICAPGSPQVEAILAEMLPHLNPGSVVVDCSTADPNSTIALNTKLEAAGCSMADAPLGGTPVQAHAGALAAMVGASDETFARIAPVLNTWAGALVHLGPVGDGHKMKLLNNFLSMGYAALYAEALTLAQKSGISPAQFDSVLRGSRMDCGFYQTFMGHVTGGDPESHKFTLTNAAKDMRYLAAMADAAGMCNPMGNAVKNSFAGALSAGLTGPADFVPHLADHIARVNGTSLDKPS